MPSAKSFVNLRVRGSNSTNADHLDGRRQFAVDRILNAPNSVEPPSFSIIVVGLFQCIGFHEQNILGNSRLRVAILVLVVWVLVLTDRFNRPYLSFLVILRRVWTPSNSSIQATCDKFGTHETIALVFLYTAPTTRCTSYIGTKNCLHNTNRACCSTWP